MSKAGPSAWDFLDSAHFSNACPPSTNLAMIPTSSKLAKAPSRLTRDWFHCHLWLDLCIRISPLRTKTSCIFSLQVHPSSAIKYQLPTSNAVFATFFRQHLPLHCPVVPQFQAALLPLPNLPAMLARQVIFVWPFRPCHGPHEFELPDGG